MTARPSVPSNPDRLITTMTDWIDAAREGSLAPGEHLLIDVDGVEVAIFNIDGA